MSESPERVHPYWLDPDVAQWLHELAAESYDGDVEKAMNESLRAVKIAMTQPEDPWSAVSWQAKQKAARQGRR